MPSPTGTHIDAADVIGTCPLHIPGELSGNLDYVDGHVPPTLEEAALEVCRVFATVRPGGTAAALDALVKACGWKPAGPAITDVTLADWKP